MHHDTSLIDIIAVGLAVVGWIATGPVKRDDPKDFFRNSALQLLRGVLAHICLNRAFTDGPRTLRTLREIIAWIRGIVVADLARLRAEQLRILLALLVLAVCFRLALELLLRPDDLYSLQ